MVIVPNRVGDIVFVLTKENLELRILLTIQWYEIVKARHAKGLEQKSL
jgi:hypothetical protein